MFFGDNRMERFIGEAKEAQDTTNKVSGFNFTVIAADCMGVRFAEVATGSVASARACRPADGTPDPAAAFPETSGRSGRCLDLFQRSYAWPLDEPAERIAHHDLYQDAATLCARPVGTWHNDPPHHHRCRRFVHAGSFFLKARRRHHVPAKVAFQFRYPQPAKALCRGSCPRLFPPS